MGQRADVTSGGGLVLVTGAAGALGCAIATGFVKHGHDLLLHDYVSVEATETAVRATSASVSVSSVTGDILDPAFAGKLFDALGSRRIQVLAHAGGVDNSRKDSQHIFETNFTAIKKLVETFTSRMEDGGVIILVASLEGTFISNALVDFGAKRHAKGSWSPTVWLLSKTSHTSYAVAQRCIQLYVKQKATELSSFGVRIVSVSPGLIEPSETEAHVDGSARTKFIRQAPMNRYGRADEIASVVAFLASSGATYITGTDIAVDGGLASQRWKATRTTATSLVTGKGDRHQVKNTDVAKVDQPTGEVISSSGDQKRVVIDAQPHTDGVAAQSPIRSTLGSIRSRLARVQQDGLGGQRPAQLAPTAEKATETTKAEGTAANPGDVELSKEVDTVKDDSAQSEPIQGEPVQGEPVQGESMDGTIAPAEKSTAPDAFAGGATEGGTVTQAQATDKEVIKNDGQPSKEGGRKSAYGSLRSRLDRFQREGSTNADDAHKPATSERGQTGTGLKSVVGTVRARMDKIQQDDADRVKKSQEGTGANDGEETGGKGLKSSVGTLRTRLKELQERNAARAKAASTNGAQGPASTGIFQPATEATEGNEEPQPAAPVVKEE